MTEKTIKTRVVNKHDVEANWLRAENFVPLHGELIIYDVDDTHPYERFKIGDGETVVSELPFAFEQMIENIVSKMMDAGRIVEIDGGETNG